MRNASIQTANVLKATSYSSHCVPSYHLPSHFFSNPGQSPGRHWGKDKLHLKKLELDCSIPRNAKLDEDVSSPTAEGHKQMHNKI